MQTAMDWSAEGKKQAELNPDCEMIPHANRLFRAICKSYHVTPTPGRYRHFLQGWTAARNTQESK